MDEITLGLIVSQTVTFLMLIISEALGVSTSTPINAILQVFGIFKPTPPAAPREVQMTALQARQIVLQK